LWRHDGVARDSTRYADPQRLWSDNANQHASTQRANQYAAAEHTSHDADTHAG
jgi:hypothetical protein